MAVIDTALNVTILRKETVTMYASSRQLRDKIVAEFNECIDAAAMCKFCILSVNLHVNRMQRQ